MNRQPKINDPAWRRLLSTGFDDDEFAAMKAEVNEWAQRWQQGRKAERNVIASIGRKSTENVRHK